MASRAIWTETSYLDIEVACPWQQVEGRVKPYGRETESNTIAATETGGYVCVCVPVLKNQAVLFTAVHGSEHQYGRSGCC